MTGEPDRDREERFVTAAKAVLDGSVRDLDPATVGRLRAARRSALEPVPVRVPRFGWAHHRRFVWAGGLATVAATVLAAFLYLYQPVSQGPAPALEDLELITSSEGLEFYDDLDFYRWLADAGVEG